MDVNETDDVPEALLLAQEVWEFAFRVGFESGQAALEYAYNPRSYKDFTLDPATAWQNEIPGSWHDADGFPFDPKDWFHWMERFNK